MTNSKITEKFEMDGIHYETDKETLSVLRSIVPDSKKNNDATAVAAIMSLGLKTQRIKIISRMRILSSLKLKN